MTKKSKKIRVIIRPFIPRRNTYPILINDLKNFIEKERCKFKKYLYVGWQKRAINGKKQLRYFIATGDTLQEARKNFKKSESFNENIWYI